MLQKVLSQSLLVMGAVFILALLINILTPLAMFSNNAQIAYLTFFIVYLFVIYLKDHRQSQQAEN